MDVVEAPAHALPEIVGNDRRDLRRRGTQLLGQRDDLLQRPVVQVEAETHDAPLAGSHEVVLALHSPVEEGCPLEKRCQRVRSFLEVLLEMLRLGAARPRATSAAYGRSHRSTTLTCTWAEPTTTPSSAARATSRSRRLRGALPCETRQVVEPAASRIQREPAAAGASSTSKASASSAATVGGSWANSLLARARRKTANAAASGGRPSSSAAVVTATRASPGSSRCSTAIATIASPEEVECGPLAPAVGQAPRPHLAGTKRSTQVAWKERRRRQTVALPAPIAAARAISSEARVALTRGDPPVRRSVHSFHNSILRSMNVLNNGTLGPTVDHRPERRRKGRSAAVLRGFSAKALPFPSA